MTSEELENKLKKFLPDGTEKLLAEWILHYKIKVTVKRERKTKAGDYTPPINGKNHKISINDNLNPYAFLITFLHELAHLTTFEKFGRKLLPHGSEWRSEFRNFLHFVHENNQFPSDIKTALNHLISKPTASTCCDIELSRVLRKYDKNPKNTTLVENLPENSLFIYYGRIFKKLNKRRTRFGCMEYKSKQLYNFNPLTEVILFSQTKNRYENENHY